MPNHARHEFQLQDQYGNILTTAQVTVTREGGALEPLFSDRLGASPISNPINVNDASGVVAFHCKGGAFRIDVSSGSFTRTLRYVAIGTMGESDSGTIPVATPPQWVFDNATADADPGNGEFRFNNASPGSTTQVFIDNLSSGGATMSVWLDTIDDSGDTSNRGYLTITDPDNPATVFAVYAVTGSVVDGTGYRKLTVVALAGVGSFTLGKAYVFSFTPRGPVGVGDVTGPGSSTSGNVAVFSGTTGKVIADGGAAPLLQGRHSVWVPAAAMTPNGASPSFLDLTSTSGRFKVLAFDPGSFESAFFHIAMPKSWNEGTITAKAYWAHPATATNFGVVWQIAGGAFGNDDTLDGGGPTAVNLATDTGGTTNDLYITDESSALTLSFSPQDHDLVMLRIGRDATNVNDNLAVDAYLIGVMIFMNLNLGNDA
jgi:hypothetical protein